jgi:hypothetical protein
MSDQPITEDRHLPPGTRVRLEGHRDDGVREHGIVVACWQDNELSGHDCYVAYFENEWPSGKPVNRPGIVRIGARFLIVETNDRLEP